MKKIHLNNRIMYLFDNLMSKGAIALIGWLTLISLIATLLVSSIAWFIGIAFGDNLFHQFWVSIMYTLTTFDPTEGHKWGSKIALMFTLFIGLFTTSILIGILTTGIEDKMRSLRKGRSRVIESGHIIILGWSNYIFSIISELISANLNQKKSCIVILAEKDKVEMEDEIHEKIKNFGKTKIVCRTGNPIENIDLELTSPNTSKSIIILRPEGDNTDFYIIKTLLSIIRNPERRERQYHIVTEIHDQDSLEIAKIIGKNEIEFVFTKQFISRLIAQTSLQIGLSSVYSELLEFAGNEIYIKDTPDELIGKTFDNVLFAFDDSTVIGVYEKNQTPKLNPQLNTIIKKNDKLIMIAADDETPEIKEFSNKKIDNSQISSMKPGIIKNENIMILGWNDSVPYIISELDNYLTKGSKVIIASNIEKNEIKKNINLKLKNLEISIIFGDTTHRNILNSLPLKKINHAIVIPYIDTLDAQNADASTLTTLLHLRDIRTKEGYNFSILSEMIDIKNRKLVEVEKIDDFVVSEKLVGLILSQISENKILAEIFSMLLNPGNVEIYIKPVLNYIKTEKDVNFYTIIEAAKRHKEIAIGYRINSLSNDSSKKYGMVLNPDKNDLIKFTKEDFVIVIAEC